MGMNDCPNDSCFSVIPNGEDFYVDKNDCEIQVDLVADKKKSIVIWGRVSDCHSKPIPGALIKLLKYMDSCSHELRGICHTYTDKEGYYQFDLPADAYGKYRVIVSKSAYGRERRVQLSSNPCNHHRQLKSDGLDCGKSYMSVHSDEKEDKDIFDINDIEDYEDVEDKGRYGRKKKNNVHYY